MFLHANVVRVKEGKNNKTFSDKRKPFKWQGEKRRFGEAFIKGKKVQICAPHTTYLPHTQLVTIPLGDWLEKKSSSYNHKTTIWVFHQDYLNPEFHKILSRVFPLCDPSFWHPFFWRLWRTGMLLLTKLKGNTSNSHYSEFPNHLQTKSNLHISIRQSQILCVKT